MIDKKKRKDLKKAIAGTVALIFGMSLVKEVSAMVFRTNGKEHILRENLTVDGDILPKDDISYDLGSIPKRFAETHTNKLFATTGTGTTTIGGNGAIIFGLANDDDFIEAQGTAFAGGISSGHGETCKISATGLGSFAVGSAGGSSELKATADASFAQGEASGTAGILYSGGNASFAQGSSFSATFQSLSEGSFAQGVASYGTLESTSSGAFAQGYAYVGTIQSTSYASFAQGASFNSLLQSTGYGSFAQGYAGDYYGYGTAEIKAIGFGSSAQGFASGYSTAVSKIETSAVAVGGRSQGYAYHGNITSTEKGAFASGSTYYGNITASGQGAFACGFANGGTDVEALQDNSFQFGKGTNNTANSLQVGANVNVNTDGSVWVKEKASEADATATWGKLWVKNTVPCELWFTDDAGTSTKIV